MPDSPTSRAATNKRLAAAKTERKSFDSQYMELAQFVDPRRGRFFRNQRNQGGRSYWNKIFNSEATWALRVATGGMFAGIMNPTAPWFLLGTDDPGFQEFGPAKDWFFIVGQQMNRVFNASNLYNMAPMMLREELLFGTGCMSHVDDRENLARFYTHTVGSYWIAQDDRFVANSVYREFEQTTQQIIRQFSVGGEVNPNISRKIRDAYDRGDYNQWYSVVQAVEPNPQFIVGSLQPTQRPFRSVYYEPSNPDRDTFLSEKGFDEFPFHVPRWELTNEDVYATNCPGMTALGDVRQLQHQEKKKGQALDKSITPPLHGPASLQNQAVSVLPGHGTWYDAPNTQNILRPIYEINPNFGDMAIDMDRVEKRIGRDFYVDLFLAITEMEGIQPRNQLELAQRHGERLLQLGPTLQRQYIDFLSPTIARTFNQMVRASTTADGEWLEDGIIPPPPPELQNRPLIPRYISTLAIAQQSVETGTIERLGQFTAGLMEAGLSDGRKFDGDQAIDRYATLIGAPADLIVPDEVIAEARAAEQQRQQEAEQLEAAQQMASAAQAAGGIDVGGGETLAGQVVGGGQ